MKLIASRSYDYFDSSSETEIAVRDTLVRHADGSFLLHVPAMPDGDHVLRLNVRSALSWLGADPDQFGIERRSLNGRSTDRHPSITESA